MMIEITFEQFHNQDYVDVNEVDPPDYQLYVVKNGLGEVLYVGISKVDIWDRWFGNFGHMLWDGNVIYGYSSIGEKIADHMPDSLQWKIQLWTPDDCREFCEDRIPPTWKNPRLHDLEAFMVQKLRPAYNVHYNPDPGRDSTPMNEREKRRKEALDKAYYEIFEKGRGRTSPTPPPPHREEESGESSDSG